MPRRSSPAFNVAALLARTARVWPRLPAVALGAGALHDYASFAARVARQAAGMRAAGLASGDRVAIVARNHPAYLDALFACWWAGLVAVPVNAKLHAKELAFVIEDCGGRFAFVDADWHVALSAAAVGANALRDALQVCLLAAGKHHFRSSLGIRHGNRLPDSARRAGNKRNFIFQTHFISPNKPKSLPFPKGDLEGFSNNVL